MTVDDELPDVLDYRRIDAEAAAEVRAARNHSLKLAARRAAFCLGAGLLCGGLGAGMPNSVNAEPMMFVGGAILACFVPLRRRDRHDFR